MLDKNIILDVGITNAAEKDILEYIFISIEKKAKSFFVVTPNPEILVFAYKNNQFKKILNNADLALPDGVGVILAGRILGKPFKERVTGVDLVDAICKESADLSKRNVKNPITIGFLGGRQNVAEKTAECLVRKYPGLNVVFIAEEWGEDGFFRARKYHVLRSTYQVKNEAIHNTKYIIQDTDAIDILFVAFGFPKQEEWMAEHKGKIPVKVMVGVGGAFDYISGRVDRAPVFVRSLGLEWLYRLIAQPWRIKRQLALIEFILLLLKEKITS